MKTLQVTLGSGATGVVTRTYGGTNNAAPFITMTVQNNAAHTCYLGDSTVTASGPGIKLQAGGSATISTDGIGSSGDATEWYLAGTASDVIDVNLA